MNYKNNITNSTPGFYVSAHTKNQIIDAFARDKQMRKEIERFCKSSNIDDLLQMTYLYLLEKPESLIIDLNTNKKLKWFIFMIIKKQFLLSTSPYSRQYNTKINKLSDDISNINIDNGVSDNGQDWDVEALNNLVNKELDKMTYYEKKIFELVAYSDKYCNELAKDINIKGYSIWYTFNKVKKKLKKKIRREGLT